MLSSAEQLVLALVARIHAYLLLAALPVDSPDTLSLSRVPIPARMNQFIEIFRSIPGPRSYVSVRSATESRRITRHSQ